MYNTTIKLNVWRGVYTFNTTIPAIRVPIHYLLQQSSLSLSLPSSLHSAEDVLRGDVGAGVEHQVVVRGRGVPDIADPVLGGAGGGGGGGGGIEWND